MEPWVDWIRRTTREAELHLEKLGIDDWITIQRRRKWKWVTKVAREHHKWSHKALLWNPAQQQHHNPHRRHQRPRTRWTDDITTYLRHHTQPQSDEPVDPQTLVEMSQSRQWEELEHNFVNLVLC